MRLGIDCELSEKSNLLRASSASSRLKSNRFRAPSDSDVDDDPVPSHSFENISFISVENELEKLLGCSKDQDRTDPTRCLEKLSESRASISVSCSDAYERLCTSLEKAHSDTENEMNTVQVAVKGHEDVFSQWIDNLTAKQIRREQEQKRTLKQLHDQEKAALSAIEKRLQVYEATEAERTKERLRVSDQIKLQRQKDIEIEEELNLKQSAQKQLEKVQVDPPIPRPQEKAKLTPIVQKEPEHVMLANNRLKKLESLQQSAEEILASTDPSIKKLRVELKKQGGACNQISSTPSSVQRVVQKINSLLQQARNSGQKVYEFALILVAGNLMKQARNASDYRPCFPLAYVMTMCCVFNAELTEVLLAYFHKLCVYTIPKTISKQKNQLILEYKRSLGFEEAVGESNDVDGLEHVTEYSKRMTMIAAVLAAFLQTRPLDNRSKPKGIQLEDCWAWLARLVNDPVHLMTGPIVLTILEVAGYELCEQYKSQFRKLMVLIETQICPKLSRDAKSGAANAASQLETFISKYKANQNRILEPEGRKLQETQITEQDEERTEDDGRSSQWNRPNRHGGGRGRGYRQR